MYNVRHNEYMLIKMKKIHNIKKREGVKNTDQRQSTCERPGV
jgi:hypothetical protein